MSLTLRQLASLLEFEYPCERCHERPAVVIFDVHFVCAHCRQALDQELLSEGRT